MVYQRVPKPPVNIRDFVRTKDTTDDDLMMVTLEDGGQLFFAFKRDPNVVSDPKWRLDKQLLPENLSALLQEHDLASRSDFILSDGSGSAGKIVRLDIEPSTRWDVAMRFVSESAIKTIRPARRPRKPNVPVLEGRMHSERSSDYH